MQKTILITGATDGIGLLTAQKLFSEGHQVLLHGRNEAKLTEAAKQLGGAQQLFFSVILATIVIVC